jgi:hypothetical protein
MASKQFLVPGNHATVRGIVAPGATATLYTTGTTTPQAFYSDESRLVSLGSTITADAIGNFPIAYQDETVPFRLILKDRLGTELDDIDPYYFGVTTFNLPAAANSYAARSDMAAVSPVSGSMAYLREAGREGTFVFDTSNLATLVTADTQQGIYVAPSSDTTGASGAWVRKFAGPAESTWFGVSTSATAAANVTAFTAALATLYALRISGYGHNSGSIGLHTPAGHYTFNNKLSITHALEISGDYVTSGGGTVFEWTANTHGFEALSTACNGAKIRGFMLQGTNAGSNCHAINQTGNLKVIDVFGKNWSGNCINADSTSGGLSGSEWRNVTAEAVGWTLYIQGADSNGCLGANIGASAVRFGAVFDGGGIGNTFIGGICNSAGLVSGYVTRCHSGGHIYMVGYGQETAALTNAPSGTTASNTYWWYVGEGTAQTYQPTWASGMGGATLYFSSPYCSQPDDGNVRTQFDGVYVEQGLNAIVLSLPSIVMGGQILVPVYTSAGLAHGGYVRGDNLFMIFNAGIKTEGDIVFEQGGLYYGSTPTQVINSSGVLQAGSFPALTGDVTTAGGSLTTTIAAGAVSLSKMANMATASVFYRKTAGSGAPEVQTLATLKTDLGLTGTNSGDQTITLTSDVTGSGTGSFATTIAANVVTYAKFQQVAANSLVGNPTGSLANAQGITLAGGLAFSGTTLTAAGALTPTSVASTGAVTSSSASAGIGYATGAGGTVTQITSKATGVTLNKICGQITMNGAALAAGAKVSFAVSNTSCAATDIPQVAVVSGGTANAYRANVTAVAANSFTVTVENITAGSLSEAPVIGFFINKAVTA